MAAEPFAASAPGPAQFDIALYRGDSRAWQFILWADANKTQPVDLTGYQVAAEMRVASGAIPAIIFTTSITMPNTINMNLHSVDSGNAKNGFWDLELTDATAHVVTILRGTITVTDDITNSDRP